MKYYKHQTKRIGQHTYTMEWKFKNKRDAQRKAKAVRKKKHYVRVKKLPKKTFPKSKWGVWVGPYNPKKGKKYNRRRKR